MIWLLNFLSTPTSSLHVNGNTRINNDTGSSFLFLSSTQAGANSGNIAFQGYDDSSSMVGYGNIIVERVDTTTSSQKGRMKLYTYDSGASNVVMTLDSGNVGVGTVSPQATLDVNGYLRLAKNASQPEACSAANDGALALTSQYTTCVCKGGSSSWVSTTDGTTACSW